mgnify:FL=1|tara:strand:- start:392 stop:607 length:216 start_codon:yes stop_codon:yes gene_type:complete
MTTVNPIGRQNLMFRRTTKRYGKPIGSWSNLQGYLSVARDIESGKFVSRTKLSIATVDRLRNVIKLRGFNK